jgi:general secretion pathway protein G
MSGVSKQSGFTLVELMVVISIMAVLTGIIGGSFLTTRFRARDAERKNNMSQLQRALEMYYTDNRAYPAASGTEIAGCGLSGTDACAWGAQFKNTTTGTVYMVQLPSDAKRPTIQYVYEVNATHTKYRLYTRLENEQDSGTDHNHDGNTGDTYSVTCGTSLCNFGMASPTTTMEEVW